MKRYIPFMGILLLFFSTSLTSFAAENQQLVIKSEGVALVDSETGAVLFSKNAEARMYPASLTKIATAIYAIEKGELDSIVTVSGRAVRQAGTSVYLNEGEQVTLKKLIQGMLINSGNDAAVAIAEHIDGSVERFAENMNVYLKKRMGVGNTHFTNPNGLFDENHYTTAMDLAIITNYAIQNPIFAEIFGTKELPWEGQSWHTTLFTHHRILKGELPYLGITGGKTGYTTESKQTLATTADNGSIKLTAIVLKSDKKNDKYIDTKRLFDYGFNVYQHGTIKQGEIFNQDAKEFYIEHDTLITENIDGSIKRVSNDGILSIETKDGQVVQLVPLKEKEQKKESLSKKSANSEVEKQQISYVFAIFGIIIIVFVGIFINVRKKFTKRY
ncbi:MAG: D-alanyl-D-alanine carboxypeptidase [Bacillus sp. (in: Bacteria)]|nr:D-alanyl-D-alanine carboxypeptidase [Bacillus sp. (in: firmicutes)]